MKVSTETAFKTTPEKKEGPQEKPVNPNEMETVIEKITVRPTGEKPQEKSSSYSERPQTSLKVQEIAETTKEVP